LEVVVMVMVGFVLLGVLVGVFGYGLFLVLVIGLFVGLLFVFGKLVLDVLV